MLKALLSAALGAALTIAPLSAPRAHSIEPILFIRGRF